MEIKKFMIGGLSILLCGMMCIQSLYAKDIFRDSTYQKSSEVILSNDETRVLEQYNRIFIDTGFINEFELVNSSIACKSDVNLKMKEYGFNEEDTKFINQFIKYSITTVGQVSLNSKARIKVKNWSIYLTNKEVKKYFANVLTLGPVGIVGALTAIGSVGGPVGSIITFIVSALGANHISVVVKKAYKANKGLKIGFGGISVN